MHALIDLWWNCPTPLKSVLNTNLSESPSHYAENWNRAHGCIGVIDLANFSPSKNPVIAKFFKEIGRVDELGSGIRNTFKYCGMYTPGTNPEFIEGDVFRTVVPLEAKEDNERILVLGWDEVRERLGDRLGDI